MILFCNEIFDELLKDMAKNLKKADKVFNKHMKKDLNFAAIDIIMPPKGKYEKKWERLVPYFEIKYEELIDSANKNLKKRIRSGIPAIEKQDIGFMQEHPRAAEVLLGQTNLIKNASSATYDKLKFSLSKGIANGLPIYDQESTPFDKNPSLNKLVKEVFPEKTNIETMRIARTESLRTANMSNFIAYEDNGDVVGYEWITVINAATRDSHRRLNGMRIPKGESFMPNLKFPLDQNAPAQEVVNCRCTAVPLVDKNLTDPHGISPVPDVADPKLDKPKPPPKPKPKVKPKPAIVNIDPDTNTKTKKGIANELMDDFVSPEGKFIDNRYTRNRAGETIREINKNPMTINELKATRRGIADTFNKSLNRRLTQIGDDLHERAEFWAKGTDMDYWDGLVDAGWELMELTNPQDPRRARWSDYVYNALKPNGIKANQIKMGSITTGSGRGGYNAFISPGRNLTMKKNTLTDVDDFQIMIRNTTGDDPEKWGWQIIDMADADIEDVIAEIKRLKKADAGYYDYEIAIRKNDRFQQFDRTSIPEEDFDFMGSRPWTSDESDPELFKVGNKMREIWREEGVEDHIFQDMFYRTNKTTLSGKKKVGKDTFATQARGNSMAIGEFAEIGDDIEEFYGYLRAMKRIQEEGLAKKWIELSVNRTATHEMGHILSTTMRTNDRKNWVEAIWKAHQRGWRNKVQAELMEQNTGIFTNTRYPAANLDGMDDNAIKTFYEEILAESHSFYIAEDFDQIPIEIKEFFDGIYDPKSRPAYTIEDSVFASAGDEILDFHNKITEEIFGESLSPIRFKSLVDKEMIQ